MIFLFIISFCLVTIYCNAQGALPIERDKIVKEIATSPFEAVVVRGGGYLYFHYSPNTTVELKGADSFVVEQ